MAFHRFERPAADMRRDDDIVDILERMTRFHRFLPEHIGAVESGGSERGKVTGSSVSNSVPEAETRGNGTRGWWGHGLNLFAND